jgi:hypothetical protein
MGCCRSSQAVLPISASHTAAPGLQGKKVAPRFTRSRTRTGQHQTGAAHERQGRGQPGRTQTPPGATRQPPPAATPTPAPTAGQPRRQPGASRPRQGAASRGNPHRGQPGRTQTPPGATQQQATRRPAGSTSRQGRQQPSGRPPTGATPATRQQQTPAGGEPTRRGGERQHQHQHQATPHQGSSTRQTCRGKATDSTQPGEQPGRADPEGRRAGATPNANENANESHLHFSRGKGQRPQPQQGQPRAEGNQAAAATPTRPHQIGAATDGRCCTARGDQRRAGEGIPTPQPERRPRHKKRKNQCFQEDKPKRKRPCSAEHNRKTAFQRKRAKKGQKRPQRQQGQRGGYCTATNPRQPRRQPGRADPGRGRRAGATPTGGNPGDSRGRADPEGRRAGATPTSTSQRPHRRKGYKQRQD